MRCGNCGKVIFGGVGNSGCECVNKNEIRNKAKNHHPTVKPIALMEYLIKLVSREGATILDPFMGSGTTGIACKKLNRHFIGIEKEPEYIKIAESRINSLPLKLL
jgi:DNA modification methylase